MNPSHGRDDVFDFERMAQYTVAHASTSAVRHFGILDVEPRSGEEVDAAGVVEMHVRQHDIGNNGRVDADAGEHLFDWSQDHATWTPRAVVVASIPVSTRMVLCADAPIGPRITQTK